MSLTPFIVKASLLSLEELLILVVSVDIRVAASVAGFGLLVHAVKMAAIAKAVIVFLIIFVVVFFVCYRNAGRGKILWEGLWGGVNG